MQRITWLIVWVLLGLPAAHAAHWSVTVVELRDDERYQSRRFVERLPLRPWGRPFAGAEVALRESRFPLATAAVDIELKRLELREAELVAGVLAAHENGDQIFILDLPNAQVAELAEATREKSLLLLNASAQGDDLRAERCAPQLLHTIPHDRQLTDGLAQFLTARRWNNVLLLSGPSEADQRLSAAFTASAQRFGLRLTQRDFVPNRDPRQRELNNLDLLTGGTTYDVVFIAEADGEWARDAEFQTQLPRPVIGSVGLTAGAWHWNYERHGAPQLNLRFRRHASRDMTGVDWAVWAAMKAIVTAAIELGSEETELANLSAQIKRPELLLDGFKGQALNFRPWDGQLRQPIFLNSALIVVERAPLPGFLHPINHLDTLGFDEPENRCQRRSP